MSSSTSGFVQNVNTQVRKLALDLQKKLNELRADVDDITSSSSTVDHGALVGLADDDHPHYARSDGTRGLFEQSGAVSNHVAAGDPHTQYLDAPESRVIADEQIAVHVGLADPHTQYLTPTEGNAAYDAIGTAAAVQTNVDAHLTDAIDAHDASAVSYDGAANSLLVKAWLTANEVNTAVGQLAGQLYAPDEGATNALTAALNALVTPTELTNPDVFSSNLIVARHLASGSVTAGKIDAQAVTTATLAAGAVTASKLAIQGGTNLVLNGDFESADFAGTWQLGYNGAGSAAVAKSTTVFKNGTASGKVTGTASIETVGLFSVTPGETYPLSLWMYHDLAGATPGTHFVRVKRYDAAGVALASPNDVHRFRDGEPNSTISAWTKFEYNYTVPADTHQLRFDVWNWGSSTGALYIDDVDFSGRGNVITLQDGVITAAKVTATDLSADAITSSNYSYTSGSFTNAGSKLDLATGTFRTPGLFVNGASPYNVAVKGALVGTEFSLVDGPNTTMQLGGYTEFALSHVGLYMYSQVAGLNAGRLGWTASSASSNPRVTLQGPIATAAGSAKAARLVLDTKIAQILAPSAVGVDSAASHSTTAGTGLTNATKVEAYMDARRGADSGSIVVEVNDQLAGGPVQARIDADIVNIYALNGVTANGNRIDIGPWVYPTMLNGWVNFSTAFESLRYRREGSTVRIEGMIKSGTFNNNVFVLPSALRPAKNHVFPMVTIAAIGRFEVQSGGGVYLSSVYGVANGWASVEATASIA